MNAFTSNPLRLQPHNTEAEQALLGAILVNNRNYEKVADFLRPEHFAYKTHGSIYEACATLINKGQQADPVTLKGALEASDVLADVGGWPFLMQLAQPAAGIINSRDYGVLIHDLHLRRVVIAVGEDMVNKAFAAGADDTADALIEEATAALFVASDAGADTAASQGTAMPSATASGMAAFVMAYQRKGAATGTLTGFADIDRAVGALPASEMTVLAARPAMGKTALATNIVVNVAQAGGAVAFFSLEMDASPLAQRVIAAEARIDAGRARNGDVSAAEFTQLTEAARRVASLPITFFDAPYATVARMRSQARRIARKPGGLALVVVDYIQLVTPDQGRRSDNRVEDVSGITRGLKLLAKELKCPVLALSQLNRAVESRDDKRPMLSDLRESGSIEQDAAAVMFLFREEYYLEREEPKMKPGETEAKYRERANAHADRLEAVRNTAEIGLAKNRFGPTTTLKLHFDGTLVQFGNAAYSDGGYS